jgi:hypothetical protein
MWTSMTQVTSGARMRAAPLAISCVRLLTNVTFGGNAEVTIIAGLLAPSD